MIYDFFKLAKWAVQRAELALNLVLIYFCVELNYEL